MWLYIVAVVVILITMVILMGYKNSAVKAKKGTLPISAVSTPLKVINVAQEVVRLVGKEMVTITEEEMVEHAKKVLEIEGVEEVFGSQDEFIEGVRIYSKGLDTKKKMSASGILLLKTLLKRLIDTRINVIEYVVKHKEEVLAAKLEKPIIITGLGRTGSTMLYNLLSQDPKSRAPRFFEISHMANPAPPGSKDGLENATDDRIKLTEERFDFLETKYPKFFTEAGKSHRSHPMDLEEELLILLQCFILQLWVPLSDQEYRDWYEREDNKEFAYIYLRLFLQMLNSAWSPDSHWVLKAPVHATYIDELHKAFPDARLVFTHRNPYKVVPSWSRLLQSYLGWYFKPNALKMSDYGRYISESHQICVGRMIKFQEKLEEEKYFNIDYDEMIKDPIQMVQNLYDHFGLEFTDEFKEGMENWIKENRQGKYGRAPYSLADYELDEKYIESNFSDYVEHFLNSENF